MSNKETKQSALHGKPWSTHSKHNEYSQAFNAKEKLLPDETLQVKIRRYSDETFHVKTRLHETEKPETVAKEKKEKPKTRAGRRAEKMRRKAEQEKKL